MTLVMNIFQYIFPVLVVSIAAVLLCFYLHARKKRAAYDVTIAGTQDDNTSSVLHTISLAEHQVEVDRLYNRLPPRYSTVDHPPPYSLFDPKLTSVWPGGLPPDYEMYPVTLPLAPHHWMTPIGPLYPTPSPSPTSNGHPQPQTLLQTSTN